MGRYRKCNIIIIIIIIIIIMTSTRRLAQATATVRCVVTVSGKSPGEEDRFELSFKTVYWRGITHRTRQTIPEHWTDLGECTVAPVEFHSQHSKQQPISRSQLANNPRRFQYDSFQKCQHSRLWKVSKTAATARTSASGPGRKVAVQYHGSWVQRHM